MRSTTRWLGLVAVAAMTGGCGFADGALAPRGPGARRVLDLFLVSLGIAVVVFVVVGGLVLFAIYRRGDPEEESDESDSTSWSRRFVFIGGLVIPSVILMTMLGFTVNTMMATPQQGEIRINITGHQYWWEVYYPEAGFETANEIHIPVDRPVELRLRSDDVIHSFWVPALAGKQDLVPGHETTLVIEADEPGVYRGFCAEYCGLQHAKMQFLVIAESSEDYQNYLDQRSAPASGNVAEGRRAFLDNACAGCHTIRGTEADGELGPDLTHVASRRTLGAATLELTHENLVRWVANAQDVKPGNEMPPMQPVLTEDEFDGIIAYLESLE